MLVGQKVVIPDTLFFCFEARTKTATIVSLNLTTTQLLEPNTSSEEIRKHVKGYRHYIHMKVDLLPQSTNFKMLLEENMLLNRTLHNQLKARLNKAWLEE